MTPYYIAKYRVTGESHDGYCSDGSCEEFEPYISYRYCEIPEDLQDFYIDSCESGGSLVCGGFANYKYIDAYELHLVNDVDIIKHIKSELEQYNIWAHKWGRKTLYNKLSFINNNGGPFGYDFERMGAMSVIYENNKTIKKVKNLIKKIKVCRDIRNTICDYI